MTTTLRVIIDQMVAAVPGGIGRYTEEITRELINTAPSGCDVVGIVSSSPQSAYDEIAAKLPGLSGLYKSALARRELTTAWQHGFTRLPGRGMLHSTSMMAPLHRHDRLNRGDQVVVTIHDTVPWSHPETLTPHGVAWHKAMAKRAERYADGVVVPTHAVAEQLSEIIDFGDRIRVIGGAVSSTLEVPADGDERAERLDLPERYVMAVGTLEPRKGLDRLIRAMASTSDADIPLIIAGPKGWGDVDVDELAAAAGVAPERVKTLGYLSNSDLAVAMDRATVFAYPSLAEGFGLPVLEAMHLGTPVIHTDVPALMEVAADAGLVVALDDDATFVERLAGAIDSVIDDSQLASRLGYAGMDRSKVFSWRNSADKVWQLHADL
ncbi:glycosyltransferase family 1 protein [Salinibacterium sp. G-O1]|uniref:glycosyltransferase family 4 protein n=1 Tax=Salinibacterium sp. G-O1 TaxID=3046208 RepID=UPI0024B9AA5B|nr:glycosyltransferase family 1 protein [Salinibacterium sp. G-O1]MDJ0336506.1 glycosyltransferase family 1 protein [Salinibacterium sp. G-O1]